MTVPDLTVRAHEVLWVPAANIWRWSDEIWALHGYETPEAELTRELAIAHAKHVDHPRIFALWARLLEGEHLTFIHDVVTVQARQRPTYMGLRTVSRTGEQRVVKGPMFDLSPDPSIGEDAPGREASRRIAEFDTMSVLQGRVLIHRYASYLGIGPEALSEHFLRRADQTPDLSADTLDHCLADAATGP
ncbi:hypothetical protein [Aeromicrobium piscarium]|uniref:PAS domain-containing protein n=1 Tax=Aeromicrobium piscarium TaxID=2590901 RepID=A0A554SP71_9ACTN|nr:hypothetical protein [Aeromicrobium piscarium]TSD68163.1 hypothetical protein FNM00_00775 [Aeromicrobium piscarium]